MVACNMVDKGKPLFFRQSDELALRRRVAWCIPRTTSRDNTLWVTFFHARYIRTKSRRGCRYNPIGLRGYGSTYA